MRRRAFLIALAALAGGLLATGRPLRDRLERWLGIERALVFDVQLPDGADADAIARTWRARLDGHAVEVTPGQVKVGSAEAGDADAIAGELTLPGSVALHAVREGEPAMQAMYKSARLGELGADVTGEVDSWHQNGGDGASHYDFDLQSAKRIALEYAFAHASLPAGTHAVYERTASGWRSYLIDDEVIVDQRDIVDAVVVVDDRMNRPEVMVTLSDEGRARFGDATTRLTGHKLAILFDDMVVSAPVIETAITGGRMTITMGAGRFEEQQVMAEAVAAILRSKAPILPPGLTATLAHAIEPADATEWMLRIGAALFFGFLGALVIIGAARGTKPVPRVPRTTRGAMLPLLGALAITIAVPIAMWLAERIQAPGMLQRPGYHGAHIVALGMWPALAGYFLGEVLAWLVPRWRSPRRVQPAAILFALLIAVARGYVWGRDYRWLGLTDHAELVTLSLVAGAMLWFVAARLITLAGICNGWIVLYGVSCVRGLDLDVVGIGLALTGAVLTLALIDTRAGERRQPVVGYAAANAIVYARGLLHGAVRFVTPLTAVWRAMVTLSDMTTMLIAIAITVVALAALRIRSAAAIAKAIGYVALIAYLGGSFWNGAFIAAALVELLAGLARRARMGDAVAIAETLDVDRADDIVDELDAAGIPAIAAGSRVRALRRIFAAWCPVVVYVPKDRVDEARRLAGPRVEPTLARAADVFA